MLTVLQAFINGKMRPSKSRPAPPQLTLEQGESFDCSNICIVPPPDPQQIISPLLLPKYLPEHAITDEEDEEEWDEERSNSICGSPDSLITDSVITDSDITDSVITHPNSHQQEQQDGSKGKRTKTRGKITFNRLDPGHPRRQQQTSISRLLIPNEVSVFGPASKMKPSHKIRHIMKLKEGGDGVGPSIRWERNQTNGTALASEQFHRRRRRQRQTIEGGPSTGMGTRDDDESLKDVFSEDSMKDEAQADPLDFHTRGWWKSFFFLLFFGSLPWWFYARGCRKSFFFFSLGPLPLVMGRPASKEERVENVLSCSRLVKVFGCCSENAWSKSTQLYFPLQVLHWLPE